MYKEVQLGDFKEINESSILKKMTDNIAKDKQKVVDENYEAFSTLLPNLIEKHAGKFVVMRDKKPIHFFDTMRDAVVHATDKYDDGLFSVQEITEEPIDMGWLSCATV